MRDKKGFTLIEMVVVIVVLAIIASFAIPAILGSIKEYQNEKYIVDARKIYADSQMYTIRKKVYYEIKKPDDVITYYDCRRKVEEKKSFEEAISTLYSCENDISSYDNSGINIKINSEFKVESFEMYYKLENTTKTVSFDAYGTPTVLDD